MRDDFSKFFIVDIFVRKTIVRKVEFVVKGRALPYITNEGGIDKNIFAEVGIEYRRKCEKVL